ncbi:MAG: DUF929 family protein [Candidatus Micrarchaeota archaeon]|nr:DUF929 family protein [Candidatus Micrarchaeota archaeon]
MQRKFLILIALAVIVVVALIASSLMSSTSGLSKFDNVLVPQSIVASLNVSNQLLSGVGIGAAGNFPKKITAPALTSNGKPQILYIGAEYCPYCAAERWPMIIALSRFGTFSNLHFMTSSSTDYAPSTPTFTFYNSSYQSSYIAFTPVETLTNKLVNGTYPPLQTLSGSQSNIENAFDSGGGIPFIDFANMSIVSGSTYAPTALQGMNWTQIIAQFNNTNSTVSQSILGSANLLTAQICKATNNTPSSVCSQSYIKKIETFT